MISPPAHPLVFLILQALEQRQEKGRAMLRHSHLSTVYPGGTLGPWLQLPFPICTRKWKKERKYTKKIFWRDVSEFANKDRKWRFHEMWRIISDSKFTVLSCLITDFLKDDLQALWTQQVELAWQMLSSRAPLPNQQNKIRLLKQITVRGNGLQNCAVWISFFCFWMTHWHDWEQTLLTTIIFGTSETACLLWQASETIS